MSIIGLLVVLVIIGVVLYVVNSVIPMDARVKLILNAVVIILVLLWVLSEFGVVGPLHLNRRL
jgi:hypothetical protein